MAAILSRPQCVNRAVIDEEPHTIIDRINNSCLVTLDGSQRSLTQFVNV